MKKLITIAGLLSLTTALFAADVDTSLLKSSINPAAKIKNVRQSVIPGLYEIQINDQIVYLSQDGEKVISGDIYDLKNKISYTNNAKNLLRKTTLSAIADKDKIIYKAKDEKYKISVFTDITCPYCTKLHSNIQAFNDLGITVKYLAYPRAGIGSKPQKDMQKVWCAKDKTLALTNAFAEHKVPSDSCQGNQSIKQFLLGQDIGVNATPTLILSDGELLPGYIEPTKLVNYLKRKNSVKAGS
ncbi:MAG: thioredoxin fold domain-containing protein [Ostreibacterium sp.]